MSVRRRVLQLVIIVVVQVFMLVVLTALLPGLRVHSLAAALVVAAAFLLGQLLYWWVFVSFQSWLPIWMFPLLTFLVIGVTMYLLGNFVDGISVDNIGTGIWVTIWLTMVNAILGVLLSIDMDETFDHNVTLKLVKHGLEDQVELLFFNGRVHVKSGSIDDVLLIVGSQNSQYIAWVKGGGLGENMITTSDPNAIAEYKKLFEFKWKQAVPFDEAEYGATNK